MTDRRLNERRIHPAVAQFAVRELTRLTAENERLREAAQFVIENLPGALFNSLGRTSYDYGGRAAECAERELVNLRAALAATAPQDGSLAQSGLERSLVTAEATGSNPVGTAIAATAPQVSAQKLSDFGRPDHDQDIAGRPLKAGT